MDGLAVAMDARVRGTNHAVSWESLENIHGMDHSQISVLLLSGRGQAGAVD